jgi:hypothetical protein
MSKKDSVVSEKVENNKPKNNEIPSAEDVIQTLKVQLEEHLKQSEYHKTMAVKAQGALEVLLQLNPQEQEKKEEN